MGTIIEISRLPDDAAMVSRLLIYMNAIQKMHEPRSVSKPLAEALLACKPNRRSMKLEQIFNNVLDKYDIDFEDISGQESVKRAVEVAVAGNHNILII